MYEQFSDVVNVHVIPSSCLQKRTVWFTVSGILTRADVILRFQLRQTLIKKILTM